MTIQDRPTNVVWKFQCTYVLPLVPQRAGNQPVEISTLLKESQGDKAADTVLDGLNELLDGDVLPVMVGGVVDLHVSSRLGHQDMSV